MLSLQIAWPCQSFFLPLDNMWPLPISPYILLLTVSPGISFGLCSSTPKVPSSVPLSILRLESTLGDLTILRTKWSPLEETHQWHGSKIELAEVMHWRENPPDIFPWQCNWPNPNMIKPTFLFWKLWLSLIYVWMVATHLRIGFSFLDLHRWSFFTLIFIVNHFV